MSEATQALRRKQAQGDTTDQPPAPDATFPICPTCGELRPMAPGDYTDLKCEDCRAWLFDGEMG